MSLDLWIEDKPNSGRFKKIETSIKCDDKNLELKNYDYSPRCLFAKVTFEFKGELCEAEPLHKFVSEKCIICGQKKETT